MYFLFIYIYVLIEQHLVNSVKKQLLCICINVNEVREKPSNGANEDIVVQCTIRLIDFFFALSFAW